MPEVSVITATYNSERWLTHYFRMLDAQTFKNWEAVLVDDGSTDRTVAVIERKIAEDPRYRLIQKQPEGYPSRSRAVGLAAARSEIVAFCDHDDFWAPEKLHAQMKLFRRYPDVAIHHTDRIVWSEPTRPDPAAMTKLPPDGEIPHHFQTPEEVIYRGLRIIFSSFMGRRDQIQSIGFRPEMKGVDDFYLFVRLGLLGRICHVDVPLTYYYAHQANLSHTNNIFVDGFHAVHRALVADNVPQKTLRAIRAQALRTEAVSLFGSNRLRALKLLSESLRTYFIGTTVTRLVFLVVTLPIPIGIQSRLVRQIRQLKFVFPVVRDLFRRKTAP